MEYNYKAFVPLSGVFFVGLGRALTLSKELGNYPCRRDLQGSFSTRRDLISSTRLACSPTITRRVDWNTFNCDKTKHKCNFWGVYEHSPASRLQASLSGPFLLPLPDWVTPRKGHHPVLRTSVHRNSALILYCLRSFSTRLHVETSVPNSVSEFCAQYCFKCSANQWPEISWFSQMVRVSWRSVVAFSKQMLGERSVAHLVAEIIALKTRSSATIPSIIICTGVITVSGYYRKVWYNLSRLLQAYYQLSTNAELSVR